MQRLDEVSWTKYFSLGLSNFVDQSMLFTGPWAGGRIAQQPIEFQSRYVVALAGAPLQGLVIEDRNVAPPIADKPRSLQDAHHVGDRRSPDTEHHSKKFMGEQKIA
jgi:hypothetical protein